MRNLPMPVVPLPIQLNVHSMEEQSEHPLADLLGEEEREWSDREQGSISESPSLPGFDVTSQVSQISPGMIEAYHLSMLFSLANGFSEDSIGSAEPALANNLRNLRDLDIGAFNEVTEFIARGATFSVLRTKFPNSRNVVLKTRVFDSEMDPRKSLLQKLEAILLEVRVLTHPPLRRHNNIAQLIQIAWQGDSEDLSLKWPVLITDYADKGTLQDLFENEAGLDFTTRLALFKDVTEGLHALHGCKIVHGDLKLMNILVYFNPQGGLTAKLSDFGDALMDNPEGFREPIGTPPWTAPEYGIERPRDQLFLSDVYALGLLFWRIVLHGKDPFLDPLFDLPTDSKKADEMKSKMKQSDDFIDRVQRSLEIQCQFSSPEKYLVGAILGSTIRVLPTNRSLQRVISLLDDHFEGQDLEGIGAQTNADSVPISETQEEQGKEQGSELRLSLGGLHFSGASHVFSEPVLSALEHTAEFDTDPDRRIEASSILWRMYLAPDEFGIEQNVEKGLLFLTKSAEAGHQEDQALVLRLHRVFGRDVPRNLHSLQAQWLTEAAATGSLTAMEDLAHFRFEAELEDAKARLKGRYCGIGEEVFEFEDEASQALRDPFSDLGRSYLGAELEAGRNLGQDLRGYFLRLSATYGSVDAVVYLVEELGTEVDDANSFNDRALLLAARSGRKDVLLMLLRLGADPRLGDRGGDTPLHWLCSFDDDDVEEAAEALIQHHADIDAQADKFPVSGQLQYAETEFVAGTPLHRAICRGKLQAVRTLLRFGAGLESPALNAIDNTPLALAALLHYPDILSECLSNHRATGSREKSITSGGQSLLIPAMEGGSLHKVTIGRLIRHGEQWKKRAVDTLALLCTPGTMSHLDDLPGQPGCSALFFAARCPPHVLEFIHHASAIYINRRSKRFNNNEEFDLDPTIQHPPLHEAILHGKPLNALKLLELGADATQGETGTSPTSALYQCVLASVEDLVLAEELCRRGLRVDDGPLDYETPFMFAVRNGCYKLASFLRHQGANVNALCSRGYMWTSHTRHTLLLLLLRNNRATSLSGLNFLLDQSTHTAGNATVDIIVDPERNYTAFHAIAMLNGDSIDSDTATKALAQCERYFAPGPAILDIGSYPRSSSDKTDARVVHDAGGNTALHYAAIYANFEAIDFLLNHGANADLVNAMGMTALDIAELSYPDFETRFVPRDVPQSPSRQLEAARRRRLYIRRRLTNATTEGVNLALLERVVLDDESLDGLKRDEYKEKL